MRFGREYDVGFLMVCFKTLAIFEKDLDIVNQFTDREHHRSHSEMFHLAA